MHVVIKADNIRGEGVVMTRREFLKRAQEQPKFLDASFSALEKGHEVRGRLPSKKRGEVERKSAFLPFLQVIAIFICSTRSPLFRHARGR